MMNSIYKGRYEDTAYSVADVQINKPRVSAFPLNNLAQGTVDAGVLYPIYARLGFPGDSFHIHIENIIRANPLATPAMTNYQVKTAFFAVPLRLLWNSTKDDRFTTFINGGKDGKKAPSPPLWIDCEKNGKYSLADYLGLPLGKAFTDRTRPLAYIPRAYWKVVSDWFIHEDVFPEDGFDIEDPTTYNLPLFNPSWEPDYFNTSLPFAQRGDAPAIPIIGAGQTVFNVDSGFLLSDWNRYYSDRNGKGTGQFTRFDNVRTQWSQGQYRNELSLHKFQLVGEDEGAYGIKTNIDWSSLKPFLEENRVDFTNNSGIFINDIRQANAIQVALEISAKIGYRYNEFIFGNFGVKTSDARVQRSEMIGEIVYSPILFSEVLQTAPDANGQGVGNMKGHGITANDGFVGSYSSEEYFVVLGLQWIMPEKSIYWQGLHREWLLRDRFDWYLPVFAHLGEQPVYNYELFYSEDQAYNEGIFGYQQAWAYLREGTTILTGDFRDNMNNYVTSRNFSESSKPVYSAEFMHAKPNKNIFVATAEEYKSFIYTANSIVKAVRPLPVISDPSLLI